MHSNNRKRTVNVLEAVQTRSSQQCTRENDASVLHFQRCTSQVLLQPVSCSFPSTARRSHRMVPTSNLQLASSLLGRATILSFETSCCGGPYWTALPPGSVAVEGRTLSGSPRVSALLLAPHWAPCSIALPSLAGCFSGLPGTRVGRRRVKVRACRSSLQSVKRSACSRCRLHAVLEETINKQERTRTMNKGTSTLLSTSNVVRTAVRPRAALPPFTVQSPMYHPTT